MTNEMTPGISHSIRTSTRRRQRAAGGRRRGVASVLAMMFLVIFSSLAAAMAVVAQGNLRTADSYLRVSRAMSAAETGMVFAANRLDKESQRFVVDKGIIDKDFAFALWTGDSSLPGTVQVLPPDGYTEGSLPDGIMHAIRNAHLADGHNVVIVPGDSALPSVNAETGTVIAPPVALSDDPNAPYFRLRYEFLGDAPVVRIICEGIDRNVTRTIQVDFQINKTIEYAIISPNRIMIGKNVRIEGPLGTRYGLEPGELEAEHGHPIVMRSDFYYLDTGLDDSLDIFFDLVAEYDVDGDGRLRPNHPVEGDAMSEAPDVLVDYTGDGYVTDFDIFMAHYDADGDDRVVYDVDLATNAGHTGLTLEFDTDIQLARLIDRAFPDRAGDGEFGSDYDTILGWNDGILDIKDEYAKVHGRLIFGVAREDWELAQGLVSYQAEVMGPVRSEIDVAPVEFEADEETLREITTDDFNASMNTFDGMATQTLSDTPDGYVWEEVAYQSAGAYDYFNRPIYANRTYTNLRVPPGTNALFENCTFQGVTYVETHPSNSHENWNYAGAVERVEYPVGNDPKTYIYVPKFAGLSANLGDGTIVENTKPYSNNVRFHNCTFIGSVSGDKPNAFTHWRNKLQFTGETRFYIDPEDEDLANQDDADAIIDVIEAFDEDDHVEMTKSSILNPGWSINVGSFINETDPDPDLTPMVKLKGTIVAGILDVRGTADVHGTLLMTYRPVEGEGVLYYGGETSAFNTTIGYFGPDDGDFEGVNPEDATFEGFGEISLRYDPDAKLPDGIPWPVSAKSIPGSYYEGGGS